MRVFWFPRALDDLEHLRAYIAEHDPGSAAVLVRRITDAVKSLAEYPARDRPGRVDGTREPVVPRTPYIVAYRIRADAVHVLRVLHGAQRWPPE